MISRIRILPILGLFVALVGQATGVDTEGVRSQSGSLARTDSAQQSQQRTGTAKQDGLGTSKTNAVEVCRPDGARAYLEQLTCPGGSLPKYSRTGSVGERNPNPNRIVELGGGVQEAMERLYKPLKPGQIDSHVVDAYELSCGVNTVTIYLDMYHCAQPLPDAAPSGLLIKRRSTSNSVLNESMSSASGRSQPVPDRIDVAPLAQCRDADDCRETMLRAANPRRPEAIHAAAARIVELGKSQAGNRKAARELNSKGLKEFKKGNIDTATVLFQQAATADQSDAEVQANLGLALLRGQRLKEAQQALNVALSINPRRTNTWVPVAEYFADSGDIERAVASLCLAYEFSESQEKTLVFFENKTTKADSYAVIYEQALKRIGGTSRSSLRAQVTNGQNLASNTSALKADVLTKSQARAILLQQINEDSALQKDPARREFALCGMNEALNNIFAADINALERTVFESRLTAELARVPDEDTSKWLLLKCLINSPTLQQAMKKKDDRATTIEPKAPLQLPAMDMDDFRVDFPSLVGRRVRVKAVGHYMMNMFMLKGHPLDMSPVIADISKLPREQQRQILQRCSDITAGCSVIVIGTAGKVNFQNGIVAEDVQW